MFSNHVIHLPPASKLFLIVLFFGSFVSYLRSGSSPIFLLTIDDLWSWISPDAPSKKVAALSLSLISSRVHVLLEPSLSMGTCYLRLITNLFRVHISHTTGAILLPKLIFFSKPTFDMKVLLNLLYEERQLIAIFFPSSFFIPLSSKTAFLNIKNSLLFLFYYF